MSSRQSCDVGITEYLGSHEGFSGIIKMRFQDFIVNEIDEDGNIVHLTDMNLPTNEEPDKKQNNQANALSQNDKDLLAEFAENSERDRIEIKTGECKEERTKTHQAIRFLYPELESQTVESDDGTKVIKVTRGNTGSRSQQHNRIRRPRKALCKFVLHKQNIGTMEAINYIAKKLHVHKANGFQYAGTKDKRGITTQLVTAPVAAERLKGLNKLDSNVKVGNFSYCSKPLQLGALQGNHFSIVIRNVTGTCESSFEEFSKKGFINYFGLQRFGTTSIPTHAVGIAILKSDWQKVVSLILTPRENERDANLNEALKNFQETGDPDKALACLRFKGSIEGMLLQGLKRFGKSQLLQAITVLPRNTRKMYVHAYQSYVWNRIASKRIRILGNTACPGDLVYKSTYQGKTESACRQVEEPPLKRQCRGDEPHSPLDKSVISLTKENVHCFTLHDVVLPLPGHDIEYPGYDCMSWYKEVMEENGVEIDDHMIHKVKDYSLPGDYRHLVTLPSRPKFETLGYNDFALPLLQTDLDRLNDLDMPTSQDDAKYMAAKLGFSLPSSSYATIALRELMKTDISLSAQMKLNEEHGRSEKLSGGLE